MKKGGNKMTKNLKKQKKVIKKKKVVMPAKPANYFPKKSPKRT